MLSRIGTTARGKNGSELLAEDLVATVGLALVEIVFGAP
jgi:hypothetical protein